MSGPRFFAPEAHTTGAVVALPDDEAMHLTRVLRMAKGDRVHVFDGRGHEWHAEVSEVGKQKVTVRLGEGVAPAAEPLVSIALVVAVLKSDKMDDVVRDAVMLGVASITPLVTEHTDMRHRAIDRRRRATRWQRIAVSSAKQCGRAVVPSVRHAVSLQQALAADPSQELGSPERAIPTAGIPADGDPERPPWVSPAVRLMLVEPGSQAAGRRTLREVPVATAIEMFVGPEGGWTESETQMASAAGVTLVTLGGQTLRADAVPLVGITALRVLWNDF